MTTATSKKNYWLYFGVSLIATLLMLVFWNEWFWVGLPFVLTAYVYALDVV